MKVFFTIKRAVKRWLLRTLQPCQQMVPLMSESMERRLTLGEYLKLRLHLLVCAWCARYLKQIRFLRWLSRAEQSRSATEMILPLSPQARERIAIALQKRDR